MDNSSTSNSELRLFVKRAGVFIAVHAIVIAAFFLYAPWHKTGFLSAALDKERLFITQKPPRIVTVGGSNVAFGIDSQILNDELGANPVNLGLNGTFCMDYMLNQVRNLSEETPNAQGDIIILSFEYQHFEKFVGLGSIFRDIVTIDPHLIRHTGKRDVKSILDNGWNMVGETLRFSLSKSAKETPPIPPYSRDAFNYYGDIKHQYMTQSVGGAYKEFQLHATRYSIDDAIERMNDFADEMEARGDEVYFLFPAISDYTYNLHQVQIDKIGARILDKATFPVLNTPQEAIHPADEFLDSPYHLTNFGREKHTRDLIAALRGQK